MENNADDKSSLMIRTENLTRDFGGGRGLHGLNLEIPKGKMKVEDVCSIMNQNPVWANGLVLSSAGYRGDYYFKD